MLETEDDTDFIGVVLLSLVLDYNDSPNFVRLNPAVEQAYELRRYGAPSSLLAQRGHGSCPAGGHSPAAV